MTASDLDKKKQTTNTESFKGQIHEREKRS